MNFLEHFLNNFKCELNKFQWFSKDYISHQKNMKGIILNDYMQNIYDGFDEI
jgi:hypothetical protein